MSNSAHSGGIGVAGLLGIMFIAFKLLGIIDWSWWWVLSPFWISIAIFLVVAGIVILLAIIFK